MLAQFANNSLAPLQNNANTPDVQALQAQGYQEGARQDVTGQPSSAGSYMTMTPAQMIAQSVGRSQYTHDASGVRDPLQILGDSTNSFFTGLFTTPVEMANMGIQAVSPTAGAAVSRFVQGEIDNAEGKKSSELTDRGKAYAARNGVSSEINRQQEEEDVTNGDSALTASLKRIGRDFLSSLHNADASLIGDSAANALGSIATLGPMEKGAVLLGRSALRGAMETGAVGFGGARTALRMGGKVTAPALIGAQQAAGIDQSTAANILNMSPEELAAHSQSYQDAINAGMSDEDARALVARNAGLTAGALSFPVAAAAGELRVPLIKAPFSPGSAGEAISNVLKSGVDGAIFGADGTLSSNAANRMFANDQQDMEAGVGESIGQGAVVGLGMAGATQAPGLAGHLVSDAAGKVINKIGGGIQARGQAKIDALDAKTAAKFNDAQQGVMEAINTPEVQDHLNDAIQNAAPAEGEYVRNILNRAQLQDGDLNHPIPAIQDALQADGGATDKFDALRRVAAVAADKNASDMDRVSAAQHLLDNLRKNGDVLESPSRTIESLPEGHEALPHLRALEDVVANTLDHPEIKKAIDAAKKFIVTAQQVDPETPEGQQALHNAIKIAEHRPEDVDPDASRKVLDLAENGKVSLDPKQKTALEASIQLAETHTNRQKLAQKLGLNPEKVSRDITMEKAGEGEPTRSAIDHFKGVISAMMEGNHELAKQRLARLGKFADHMQNKVTALNEHFETAEGVKSKKRPYQQLNERTGKFNKAESRYHLSIDPKEAGGVKFANALDSDANAVHEHYNVLAKAYPELGLKEKTRTPLHPELTSGKIEDTVRKFRQRERDGKPQFDPSWKRLTTFSGDAPKAEAQASEGPKSDAKADTAPASQESASKADVESASAPKASTEEKVPAAEEKKPKTRLEHSRERAAELAKAKPGELKVADAFPADLRDKSEEGLKHFGYRTEDGKQLIRGKYHVTDDTIENLDIGDTNNKTTLGAGETRNLYRQIVAENPGVKWIHGYRITGGRVTEQHLWFEVTDRGLKSHGQDDPRPEAGADETVQTAEATPASEEVTSGSDQEAPAAEESQLTIGSDSQGQSNKSSVAKHFPQLFSNVAKKVINWFAHGFNIPEKPTSRLVGLEGTPSEHILNAIQSQTDAEKFIGGKLGKRLFPEVTEGFSHLFELAGPALEEMNNRLQQHLNKVIADNGKTVEQNLIDGRGDKNAMNLLKEYKTLNLVQENEHGKLEYNVALQESAILAGLHWLVTQDQKGRQYDQESLAEMLGVDQAEAVEYLDFFNGGHYTSDAVDALRQTIEQFWGVRAKGDIPQGLNRGISEAMAKEVIMGLKAAGLIEAKDPNQLVKETGLQYSRLVLKVPAEDRQMIKSFPDILGRLVMTEHEPIQHIGKPPEKINAWQMGFNKLVKITGKQRRTIEANQQQAYYLNTNRVETMLSMGKKQFVQLMGYPIHDEMNVNDRKSKESYNSTVEAAYDYLDGLKSQLQAQAEKGQDIGEIPVHFEWRVSRVGRFHAQGRQNPQSSKFVRMMLTPNKAELDLKTPEHRNIFQLAVAQHLGLKIENLGVNRSIEQITSDIPAKYPESFKIVQDWAAKDPTKPFKLSPDQAAVFDREFGDKLTPEVLHALPEYARFLAHSADDKFVTDLPIETDGKTDGPGHALMHLVSGGYSPKWLEMMNKVGFYIGSNGPKTIAEHVNSGLGSSSLDLYGTASNILSQISRRKLNAQQPRNLYDQRIHLFTVLRASFGSDFNFDEQAGKLQIERGVTKNPMTTYIYGAGLDGIAGKIGAEVVKKFYEAISNDEVEPRVLEALHALTHHIGIEGGDGRSWLKKVELETDNPIRATKDFTFTSEQLKNINENIKNLFVKDMQTSIDHTLTGISTASEHLRDAVQAQSIFLEAAIRQAWADKIAEKRAADPNEIKWNSSIGLSQDEMDQIRSEQTAKWHGVIEAPTGHLFPAGAGNAELSDGQQAVELSAGLNGELRTSVRAEAPGNAGVRALPYSVISQDGNVIQNMFNGSRTIDRALPVHDGINVSLDRAIEDNQTINEAVLKSWLGGEPLANAARAFDQFLEVVAKEGIPDFTPKQQEDLQRALGLDSLHPNVIKNALIQKGEDLNRVSRENRAMKNVLEKVNLNVDHMAGTESPHSVEGKIDINGTHEEQAKQLHEMYLRELDKLKPSTAVKEHVSKELQSIGTLNESTGVRTISVEELRSAKLNLRRDIMDLFHHALDAFKGNIHIGDRDSLLSMAVDKPNTKADAWYNPATNDIYLTKEALTGENLVHELIHAATRVKAFQFFNDPSQLSEVERQAFDRIERLRQQWMKNADIHGEDLKGYNHLMEVMANETDPSSALNEFMAYALTQQKLIDKGKATKVKGKLATLLVRVVKELQRVFFGDRQLFGPQKDLFSNLKFNTHIIMQSQINDGHPTATTVLNVSAHQSQAFGGDDRQTGLRKLYARHMSNLIERADSKFEQKEAKDRNTDALEKATMLATKIRAEAFPEMTPQERSTFTTMVAAFHTAAKLDPNALARVQTLFSHVIKNLTVEDFMKNPETGDEADRLQAQKKMEAISGQVELITDEKGRSSLLPVFLALANTNEQFRDILTKMEVPKVDRSKNKFTLDRHLENAGIDAMDMLEKATSGEQLKDKNVRDALDSLTYHIGKQAIDDQNFIMHFSGAVGGAVNKGNDWIVQNIDRASNLAIDKIEELQTKTDNKYANYALEFGKQLAGIASKDRANDLQEGLTELLNTVKPFKTFAEAIHEVLGRIPSNAGVIDLIKVANTTVGQLRQKFREHLPVILGDKFTQKLTEEQWNHLHKSMLQTDIASLHERYSKEGLMDLLKDPSKARAEIKMIEAEIRKAQPENADTLLRKTAQLSRWMNTHKVEDNFLRNAHAIARLHGEREERQADPTKEIVQKIDHLASLYALDSLDKDTKATLSELAQKDTDAVQYSLDYLIGQRKDEIPKTMTSDLAQMNHFKGYVPTENHEGASLKVVADSEMTKMLQMGYVRVGDYKGSAAEVGPSRGYYHSEGSGKSPFLEGVLQNVQGTAYGVDSRTGFAHGPMTAGRITDADEVKKITRARMLNRSAAEPLMPIRDQDGQIVAYERSVDPSMEARVKKVARMDKTIGQWRGRQAEEIAAHEVNRKLIDALYDMYHGSGRGITKEPKSYVNIFDPREQKRDPIVADAARLITNEVRATIEDQFGPGQFMVRRELINNAIGYRLPSVTDMWTGETRWSKDTQDAFVRTVTGIFGTNAYKYLRKAEHVTQDVVSDWKTTIIVRSVVVLAGNVKSDFFQLMSRGMNPVSIATGYAKKTTEIHNYVKSRVELNKIEADMRASTDRPDKLQLLQTRRKAIIDAQKRMSIWPLIESGQYSIISNMGIGDDDSWMTLKSLDAVIERAIHKLPEPLQTTARYYTVARDTALFKVLERAVEYSDFLGRAVLYDHLTENKKMKHEDAIAEVASDFINYDYLPGRTRSYLESMGLTWFWNYKLRAAKVAVSILRNNPLHMLLSGLASHANQVGSIGTPMRDNFFTAAADGRLLHSIGPMQGIEAGGLNPWNNLMGIYVPDI